MNPRQDKAAEVSLFDAHAAGGEYNVFTEASSRRLVRRCLALADLKPPGRVADLGCASGAFTALLREEGFEAVGADLSPEMIALAKRLNPGIEFVTADVERLPWPDAAFDGVLCSGLLHHFPDPGACLKEAHRVLKPGGRLMAFDPNRLNPAMYLYRDRTSPFYSAQGVTPNERPVLAWRIARAARGAGFDVATGYLDGLRYRYVAAAGARRWLPVYNAASAAVFGILPLKWLRAFVLTAGVKRTA